MYYNGNMDNFRQENNVAEGKWNSDCDKHFNVWRDILYSNDDGSAPEGCDDDDILCRLEALYKEAERNRTLEGNLTADSSMMDAFVREEWTLANSSNCPYEDFACMQHWILDTACDYLPTGHNLFNKCIAQTLFYTPPCKKDDPECEEKFEDYANSQGMEAN